MSGLQSWATIWFYPFKVELVSLGTADIRYLSSFEYSSKTNLWEGQ